MGNYIDLKYREYIENQLGEMATGLVDCLESTRPAVSVRLNPRKLATGEVPGISAEGVEVPWWSGGRYLSTRPDFTHDPALHQGLYYVQDASSMFTANVVKKLSASMGNEPLLYLDACAAPGGKTTAAIDALPEGSMVLANEYDFRRAEILKENVQKWGYADVVVSRGDTARLRQLPMMFDIIATDVPCSGEGMMRKDETARAQWTEHLVHECAWRQWEIVCNVWGALKPGGYLIYSTCTFNREENEQIVERIIGELGGEAVSVPIDSKSGIVESRFHTYRFFPNRLQGEGLFMAVIKKPGIRVGELCRSVVAIPERNSKRTTQRNSQATTKSGKSGNTVLSAAEIVKMCATWLQGEFEFCVSGETIFAHRPQFTRILNTLTRTLDVILPGVEVASLKGRNIIPAQGLALSTALNPDAFASVEVDKDLALKYLRRESLPGLEAAHGPVMLRYNNRPLGFANNLGNRANNLYPQPWRILH